MVTVGSSYSNQRKQWHPTPVLLLSSFDGRGNGDKKVEYLVQWNTASKWQSFYLNWGSLSGSLLWSHFLFSWCSGEGGGCPERRHHGGNICPSEQSAPFPSQSDHVQPPHLIGRQHSDLKDLRTLLGQLLKSADEWIRKLWYIYTMEYYSAIKKNTLNQF